MYMMLSIIFEGCMMWRRCASMRSLATTWSASQIGQNLSECTVVLAARLLRQTCCMQWGNKGAFNLKAMVNSTQLLTCKIRQRLRRLCCLYSAGEAYYYARNKTTGMRTF